MDFAFHSMIEGHRRPFVRAVACCVILTATAQAQASRALTVDDIAKALAQGAAPSGVISLARERCIDFTVDTYADRLRFSGATPSLLAGLRLVCRGASVAEANALPAIRTREDIERAVLLRTPRPVMPVPPIAPQAPGATMPVVFGLALGAGGYAGSSALCSSTQIAPSPYGGFAKGTYLPPGQSYTTTSSTCSAGTGAGLAVASGLITWWIQKGRFKTASDAYSVAAAAYPATKAAAEQELAAWRRRVDEAIAVAQQEDETKRSQALAQVAVRDQRLDSVTVQLQREELVARGALTAAPVVLPAPVAVAPVAAPIAATEDLAPPKLGLRNPNAVAVVIGNRGYQRTEIPSVEYADRDAELVKRYLTESFGFREENIIFETNASLSTFQRVFGSRDNHRGQLFNFLLPNKSSDVFVFYSGHGAPDPATGGAFLVPADADPQTLTLTGYPVKTLYENLAQLPARSLTVVLDACFSGLSDRGSLLRGISPLTLRVENPVLAAPNAVVLSASAGNEVSGWYDQKKHGLFTYVLLDQLSQAISTGGVRTIPSARELAAQVTPEVVRLSRRLRQRDQTPQAFGQAVDQPLPFIRR